MRLWSLHPKYLDPQGLVALWREALLARAVLKGETRGYRHHPQLERFHGHGAKLTAINTYLEGIRSEATERGYAFDRSKIGPIRKPLIMSVTSGQLEYEWRHLMRKLAVRSPELQKRWRAIRRPEPHPLFRVRPGDVAAWEQRREPLRRGRPGGIRRRT